jgi:hypothetical protein
MKKVFSCILAVIIAGAINVKVHSQPYQIPNANFEAWDGTANNAEPVNWNSFATANCAIGGLIGGIACSSAKRPHHYKVAGHRTNGTGSYYLTIYSTSVVGVVANGNMTLGQIYIGSTSASSTSNYNYTKRSDTAFSQPFTASPDSLYVWVKYWASSSTSNARINAIIHGNTDFKDPNDASTTSAYAAKAETNFERTGTTAGGCVWVQKKVPFVYNGSSTRNYILITFSTNSIPGGGSAGDSLSIDDLELIYSAWLTDIKMNGTTISGFSKGTFNYNIVFPRGTNPNNFPTITYTTEVSDVSDTIILYRGINNGIDSARSVITILAEDNITQKIYTINYFIFKSPNNLLSNIGYTLNRLDTILIPNFVDTTKTYNITLPPGTDSIPFINYTTISDTGARILSIVQPTSLNGKAFIRLKAENGDTTVYTINFTVGLSDNAKLDSLKYDGINIPNFHQDTLNYHVVLNTGTLIAPFVTAKAQWEGLIPSVTQASSLPGTATVLVTAEDGITTRTYTVYFTVALSTNASASSIKYNGISLANFHADTLHYNVELAYGTISATLSATAAWATAQVQITQPAVLPGYGQVKVIAEDTNFVKTYSIYFTVAKNTNAFLSALSYKINSTTYPITTFVDTVYSYTIVFPPKTLSVPTVMALLQDTNAHIVYMQAIEPNDTAFVNVIAEDGITTKNYRIIFKVALDTNANLSWLKLNDTLLAGFNASTLNYYVGLDTAVAPVVTAKSVDTAASIAISYPQSIPGVIVITVKAEDTTYTKSYRIYLTLNLSNNADLLEIGYKLNNTPYLISGFHKDTMSYYVSLPSLTTYTPVLTWQKADTNSKITVTQPKSPNDTGKIVVTSASDSIVKTYYVYFSVEISTNAALASITINNVNLSNFHADTNNYYITLHYDSLIPPIVGANAQSAAAHVTIKQAMTVNDSAVITVLAEDSIHTLRYVIRFTRQLSPVASLQSIGYKLGSVDSVVREFACNKYNYMVYLKPETMQIPSTITYTLTDVRAIAQIVRTPLHVNDTAIIKVKAENMLDSNVYTVIFNRLVSDNTCLDTLYVNGNPLSSFHKDSLQYTVILPWNTNQLPIVNAVASWSLSSVQLTQSGTYFGQAQIRVIAEDGIHVRTYTVQFVQGANTMLQSLSYNIEGNTYSIPTFDSADTVYYVTLPITTTAIPTLNYTLIDNRCEVDTVAAASPNGEISLIVKAWDNTDVKTYKVIFTVALSVDAHLSDLMVDSVTVMNFHPDTLEYFIEYEYGTTHIPLVEAIAVEPDAKVEITQINQYPSTAVILVKAGDTSITMVYRIHFSIEAGDNAYLAKLNINDTLIEGFDKETLTYHYVLPYGSNELPIITAEPEDSRANVSISQAIAITDTVKIKVLAVNEIDSLIYILTFSSAANNNALLSWIKVDGKAITTFDSEIKNYKYELPFDYKGIPLVTVQPQDSNAMYEITDATSIPGQTQIDIVAEDGITSATYRVNFVYANAIEDIDYSEHFIVYPNPTQNIIYVKTNTDNTMIESVQFYDACGKLLKTNVVNSFNTSLDISSLPKGVYVLKVILQNQLPQMVKIIKY